VKGKVILVGAGPGDEGLLTVKGARMLQSADVVVYDRLVGPEILDRMPAGAEKINVGKNAGSHPVPQDEINRLLLRKALEGKTVVRLKGGDCFLFGRGGEELELLQENGVPFEVVPGVPSPIGAAAYAGIPLTHRDFCSSVHFITGHRRENGALSLDYEALVRLDGTLVFLMSVATCGEIARGLMAAGMAADFPCAVVENGTRLNQRKVVATVSTLEKAVAENRIVSPALIVVGRVCVLSDEFDWFSKQPLFGRKILVTAPEASAERLLGKLKTLGADAVAAPAVKTVPRAFSLPDFRNYRAAAFTSAFGVRTFFEKLREEGKDARYFGNTKIAAIGAGTAAALQEAGILPDFVPSRFEAKTMAEEMLAGGFVKPGDKALLIRARAGSPALPEVLNAGGVLTEELPVYETAPLPYGGPAPDTFDCVTFTSASGVRSFAAACRLCGFTDFQKIRAICIGPQTAKAAEDAGMKAEQSETATFDSMANYLRGRFS
jgi:uroporphyrinogen III methyltransferase/synthase